MEDEKVERLSETKLKIRAFNPAIFTWSLLFIVLFFLFFMICLWLIPQWQWFHVLCWIFLAWLAYRLFVADLLIGRNRYIEKTADHILIDNRMLPTKKIRNILIKVGASGGNGIIMTYRVCIRLRNGFFKNISLMASKDKKEALEVGGKVADFLEVEIVDDTVY
jgi:hypothetical protein